MPEASQSSFPLSVRNAIHVRYGNRCVLCLSRDGDHCAHVVDRSSTRGRELLLQGQRLGLLPMDFERSSPDNGILLCPTCHLSYFTSSRIALCPPIPVLQYIRDYLINTPFADQLPLYDVFHLLRASDVVDLPDPSQILTYLDLFSLVPLQTQTSGRAFATYVHPQCYVFNTDDNELYETNLPLSNRDVVAMFSPCHVAEANPPLTRGPTINISRRHPQYYWQLPVDAEIMLAVVIGRTFETMEECEELILIEQIHYRLAQRASEIAIGRGRGRGRAGRGAGRGAGRRASGRGRHIGGRHAGWGGADIHKSRPKKPCRNQYLDEEASDQSFTQRRVYGVHPKDWDVAAKFSPLVDDEIEPISSYFGGSAPSLHEADHDDDSSTWNFGPSFGSDMIVATARRLRQI